MPTICIAARWGAANAVDLLVQAKANVDTSDFRGWTAAHIAADQGHLSTLRVLLGHKATITTNDIRILEKKFRRVVGRNSKTRSQCVNMINDVWTTRFMNAISADDIDACKLILRLNPQSEDFDLLRFRIAPAQDQLSSEMGNSILHHVVRYGNLELVQHMIEQGVDITECNGMKMSVLELAILFNKIELAKFFVEVDGSLTLNDKTLKRLESLTSSDKYGPKRDGEWPKPTADVITTALTKAIKSDGSKSHHGSWKMPSKDEKAKVKGEWRAFWRYQDGSKAHVNHNYFLTKFKSGGALSMPKIEGEVMDMDALKDFF